MKNFYIHKDKAGWVPEYEWTEDENDLVFTPESLNFNTFIRAFAKNKLERRYLEWKICKYFLAEKWDERLCDRRPDILEHERKLHSVVAKVWRFASNTMQNII